MTKLGEHPTDDLEWWFGERLKKERLEAVRAFVERVEKQMPIFLEGRPLTSAIYVIRLQLDGLAAMEKEANAGTNDR